MQIWFTIFAVMAVTTVVFAKGKHQRHTSPNGRKACAFNKDSQGTTGGTNVRCSLDDRMVGLFCYVIGICEQITATTGSKYSTSNDVNSSANISAVMQFTTIVLTVALAMNVSAWEFVGRPCRKEMAWCKTDFETRLMCKDGTIQEERCPPEAPKCIYTGWKRGDKYFDSKCIKKTDEVPANWWDYW
ncbi:hypothetical protein CC86DRAFT_381744 [Ophiobolus disseminans]|uniref:Secreted protein n=1 Tax=Ophiobolus disseminans TaxID=1469910 RepID=A0A6A7A171_9PLEO|nr:hypothetical protein CC86DRAFT_381744 [Ophiobolus disseminans]